VTDSESSNAQAPVVAAAPKRSKTVGGLAVVAGMLAAVVGLIDVLGGKRDIVDILLLIGGLLVSVAGLRMLRRAR
jgi:hypothetical protein